MRIVSFPLFAALLAASILLVALTASPTIGAGDQAAAAKTKKEKKKYAPISGKLSKRGYTLIALDESGAATTHRIKGHKFKLRPPSAEVTLHLRAPNGIYAGPIVVEEKGNQVKKAKKALKRAKSAKARMRARKELQRARQLAKGKVAIVGFEAGAKLGKVAVKRGKGYAKVKHRLAARWIDSTRWARATKGVPIGAGNFGRVRSKKTHGGSRGDLDLDGVPDPLDVDDDGDLILDDIDTTPRGSATGSAIASQAQLGFNKWTDLRLSGTLREGFEPHPTPVVNANAANLSFAQIESGLRTAGTLSITTPGYASGELNCRGLIYCSAGGTGRRDRQTYLPALDPNPEPFPECCDPDGDGFGSLDPNPGHILLQTNAGADEIRGGDVLIVEGTKPGGEKDELVSTLETVFDTPPAPTSYTDELGVTHDIPYPYTNAPLFVMDGPDPGSDVSATFHVWRPQRRPIPEELSPGGGDWIDIGGLQYRVGGVSGRGCPQGSYSESDPNLTLGLGTEASTHGPVQIPMLTDSAPDHPADPANTFSFTLNLTQCLAAEGISFNPGHSFPVSFVASFPPQDSHPFNHVSSTFGFVNQP